MSIGNELELEMTNLWSLVHQAASGCISIGMWEIIKEFHVGPGASWAVFLTASFTMVHAVHRHRRAVAKTLYEQAQEAAQNQQLETDLVHVEGTAAVTLEPQ